MELRGGGTALAQPEEMRASPGHQGVRLRLLGAVVEVRAGPKVVAAQVAKTAWEIPVDQPVLRAQLMVAVEGVRMGQMQALQPLH